MIAHSTSPAPLPVVVRAADHLVAHLQSRGIDRVFGIPGGAISPVFDALVGTRIDIVVCQHEAMAAYMAYGYAKATGRPGVLLVTAGPGILNALPGIAAAYHDEVPLVVLAGDVRSDFAGRGALQDGGADGLDIQHMLRSVTRFRDRLEQPERVLSLLEHAFEASLQHPRGPSLLQLPVDRCGSPVPTVPVWRLHERRTTLDLEGLAEAAALLSSAERPAILLGVGAARAGLGPLVDRIAAGLRVPILTDLEARGVVPDSSPLNLGGVGVGGSPAAARYLDQGVDVLVTLGARLDDTTTQGFGERLRPSRALVQLDHDPTRLGRAYPADVAIAGDLLEGLRALGELVTPPSIDMLLARDAAVRRAGVGLEEVVAPLAAAPFDPRSVVRALQDAFGPDAVFTSDIGNHLLFAAATLEIDTPDGFHVSLGLGGMGSGIGAAIGLAAAIGAQRPVVGICGDGGLMMVGNELATCARYGIPVVLAVLDNQELGMVRHGMENLYGRSEHCDAPEVDIVSYARSLGAQAMSVSTYDDIEGVAAMELRGPVVLHLRVDPEVRAQNPRLRTMSSRGAAHG